MTGKLTCEELKGLIAEEKFMLEYQRKQNAARVAAHRAAKRERAAEYNRKYKKIILIDLKTKKNINN
jgi:hypothetical protein